MKSTKKIHVIILSIIIFLILVLTYIIYNQKGVNEKPLHEESVSSSESILPSGVTETEYESVISFDESDSFVDTINTINIEDPVLSLRENSNTSIFISVYPLNNYHPEDIEKLFGLKTTIINKPAETLDELSEYLSIGLSGNPMLTDIFLGIDLYKIYDETFTEYEEIITDYVVANPHIKFWILPLCPSMDFLMNFFTNEDVDETISMQRKICHSLISHNNVFLPYLYGVEWLVANKINYEADGITLTSFATSAYLRNSFGSLDFQLTIDNINDVFANQSELIARYLYSQPQYADLSDTYCMFICDSLIAINKTNFSIPNVIHALSGATTIPTSIGGTTAGYFSSEYTHLTEMVSSIINNNPLHYDMAERFNSSLQNGYDSILKSDMPDKHLYIIIDMCLNDYFLGTPLGDTTSDIRTYRGGLTIAIRMLKKAYPYATIILMSPYRIVAHNSGTNIYLSTGEILSDYVNVMHEVADSEEVKFIDLYNDFNKNNELGISYLLDDKVHPSNLGCFEISEYIIEQLGKYRSQQ